MHAGRALTFVTVLALGAAVPLTVNNKVLQHRDTTAQDGCSSLHIIVARGSYEAPGEGSLGSVASTICNQVRNLHLENNARNNSVHIP